MRTLAGIGALAIAVGATVFFFSGYFSTRVLSASLGQPFRAILCLPAWKDER